LAASAAEAKLNDLQILPADVLLNAVGEANFALSQQGSQLATPPQVVEEALEQVAIPETLDPTQAAEMAAAALAAQMGSPLPIASQEVAPSQTSNSVDAMGSIGALNTAQLANDAALAQGGPLPQVSAQALTQVPTALDGTPNLQTVPSVNPLQAGLQSQSQDVTEQAQNLTAKADASGQVSPSLLDATSKLAIESMPVQLPNGSGVDGQIEITKTQQAQTLDAFNQTKIDVISDGQTGVENTPVVTSVSSSVATPSSSVPLEISKETASTSTKYFVNEGQLTSGA
jgi:hypothetical protein